MTPGMTPAAVLAFAPSAAAALVAGLVPGLGYFAALRRTVSLFVSGAGWAAPVALAVFRLAGAGCGLALAAWFGAPILLAAALGFLAARSLALRSAGRTG